MITSVVGPKKPGEEVTIEFPFASQLGAGVTISSPTRAIVCVDNDPLRTPLIPQPDLTAPAMFVEALALQGTSVFQEIITGQHAVDYKISVTVDTSIGDKLTIDVILPVRNI